MSEEAIRLEFVRKYVMDKVASIDPRRYTDLGIRKEVDRWASEAVSLYDIAITAIVEHL